MRSTPMSSRTANHVSRSGIYRASGATILSYDSRIPALASLGQDDAGECSCDFVRGFGQASADHGVARDKRSEPLLAPALRAGRTLRHHEVADFRGRIPHADLGLGRKLNAEVLQHATRVDHGLGAVRRRLVPDGGKAEHRPGKAE